MDFLYLLSVSFVYVKPTEHQYHLDFIIPNHPSKMFNRLTCRPLSRYEYLLSILCDSINKISVNIIILL